MNGDVVPLRDADARGKDLLDTRERVLIESAHLRRIEDKHSAELTTLEAFEEIKALAREMGFHSSYLLKGSEIVVAHWVGLKCRYGCAKYNSSWCCPPAAPDFPEVKNLLAEYEVALLLATNNTNSQFYRNNTEKRRLQIKQWKATIALERRLFLLGYYKAFGLPADTCALCKECAYPKQCKFPNEKRPSIEACSIDVFKTIRGLGHGIELAEDVAHAYHSYSLILVF